MRIVLDLAEAGEPIHGTVFSEWDGEEPFHGWIELAGRLEGIRTRAAGNGRLSD